MAEYAFNDQQETLTIQCVPDDEKLPKPVQTYEWRNVEDKIIVSHGNHIKVDTAKGVLEINDVTIADSGQYTCYAISENEDKIPFVHNVVGKYSFILCKGQHSSA
jgi:Immunoglobulin domain